MIGGDLAKLLGQIARVFSKHRDVTSKGIGLWIKHMGPYMVSGDVIGCEGAEQAMLDWHADMQEHGLATSGAEEMEAFLHPELGSLGGRTSARGNLANNLAKPARSTGWQDASGPSRETGRRHAGPCCGGPAAPARIPPQART